jgi:hypothetical protein
VNEKLQQFFIEKTLKEEQEEVRHYFIFSLSNISYSPSIISYSPSIISYSPSPLFSSLS